MNWNRIIYQWLTTDPELTAVVPVDSFYVWLDGPPANRPFVVLRFGAETPTVVRGTDQGLTTWAHDDPGDFQRIREVLRLIRRRLEALIVPGAFPPVWIGDSEELPDDFLNTITRNSTYRLLGRAA